MAVIAEGGTLLYATGGLAYGGVKNSASFSGPLPAGVTQFTGSRSETEVGYTIGAGIEHAFGAHRARSAEPTRDRERPFSGSSRLLTQSRYRDQIAASMVV
ncbi:MAG: hypothetical protein Q8M26_14545 [Pseudolabrys sp.]|nr:hypothetical protein [Pseudolabrys sp.]